MSCKIFLGVSQNLLFLLSWFFLGVLWDSLCLGI